MNMKLLMALVSLIAFLPVAAIQAAGDCYDVGNSVVTPNYHSKNKHIAEDAAPQKICAETAANRYLKDGKLTCCCHNPCSFFSHGEFFNENDGSKMCVTFKTWSKPVTITLKAKSCPK